MEEHPPAADNKLMKANQNTAIQIPLTATDPIPADELSFSIVDYPQHGIVTAVTYTPSTGYWGTDTFTYKATDSRKTDSNTATVTININAAPTALNDNIQIKEGDPVKIILKGTDQDPGDRVRFYVVNYPEHGRLDGPTENRVTYTPNARFSGVDTFTYKAVDSQELESNIATVDITVNAAPPQQDRPPIPDNKIIETSVRAENRKRRGPVFSERGPEPVFDMPLDGISPRVKNYVDRRLRPYATAFYNKSKKHTTRYFILQMTILATSALIPIINIAFSDSTYLRLFSAILGSIVLASTGLLQLTKSHESMIIFRMVTARLLEEYHLFLQKVGEYAKGDDEKLFIQKEESLIYDATSEYADLFRESKPEKTTKS